MNHRKKKNTPERDPIAELERDFQRWDFYMNGGGSDPFYSDGYNMNSIRNRIAWKRRALVESCTDGNIPDICLRDIPPEMPENFMAKADEIRAGAKLALYAFNNNEDYIWLQHHKNDISPKENKRVCLSAVLWYAMGLEKDIAEDDLIAMRRKVPHEHYLESFSRCRRDMEAIISQRATEPQLSLFSADAPQAGLNFSDNEDEIDSDYDDEEQEISM